MFWTLAHTAVKIHHTTNLINNNNNNTTSESPVKRWGNLMGRMTASFSASLAHSRPATSFHRTFGFSMTMAPAHTDSLVYHRTTSLVRPSRPHKFTFRFSLEIGLVRLPSYALLAEPQWFRPIRGTTGSNVVFVLLRG